ncbi:MAG: T9SS type A sorting domain-containing protein [Bacteroidota bacterium]
MRKRFTQFAFALCACFMLGSAAQAQIVYEDFDNPEMVSYFFFDGTSFDQMFSNPAMGGINTSALCGEYVRNGAVTFDVIVMDPVGTNTIDDVSDYLSGTKSMSVKVYSPVSGMTVQITLEDKNVAGPTNYPAGRHSEWTATTTTTNAWETLTFSLANQPDMSVSNTSTNRMVLLFDPGQNTRHTILWDDLMGPEFANPCGGVTPDPAIVDDAECQQNLTWLFANGTRTIESNPNAAGINTSTEVGKFVKFIPPTNDGAFGGDLDNPFNTGVYNRAHIDLYDPNAPQEFLMIFQDGNGTDVIQETFTTSSTSAWETFTSDLSSIPVTTTIEKVVLLLNPTTSTEDEIYFDNFSLSMSVLGVDDADLDNGLTVAPVPFHDHFVLTAETALENVTVSDLAGRVLVQMQDIRTNEVTVNTSDFAPGIYLVTVRDQKGQAYSQKLIRQ